MGSGKAHLGLALDSSLLIIGCNNPLKQALSAVKQGSIAPSSVDLASPKRSSSCFVGSSCFIAA